MSNPQVGSVLNLVQRAWSAPSGGDACGELGIVDGEWPCAPPSSLGQRGRVDGPLCQVAIVAGHCLEHGLHEDALQLGQATG